MKILVNKTSHGTELSIEGLGPFTTITAETPEDAVERLISLCEANVEKLHTLRQAYNAGVEANFKGAGKNWPAFSRWEKLMNELCRQAGVVDS